MSEINGLALNRKINRLGFSGKLLKSIKAQTGIKELTPSEDNASKSLTKLLMS